MDVRGEQKRTFQWNAVVDETRPPIIDEVDVNADGIKEIVIRLNAGRGTELSINDIHVLHPDTLDELHVEDPVTALNEQLKSSIEQRNGKTYIDMELNGRHISRVYDYEGSSWSENIGFGSIVSYEVVDGYLQARLDGRASITEFPVHVVADYGSDLSIQDVKLYYSSFLQPSFTEEDVKYMVEQWLPGGEITFDPKSDQYTVVYPVETGKGEPMMLKINPQTGTVYDATSGSPRMNFANREALDLPPFSNGTLYYEELHRLLEPILDAASLKLVSPESWFSGFLGDGYLMIEVVQAEREVTIKIDAFTGQWEVMGEHS
ncbi:hypothetical protein JCM10914_3644 [Paenibacillus sp. JCM 10914]|nr:hypothetical protein JCM10914_3644 [Paenibacillus sp. JCM 10914]